MASSTEAHEARIRRGRRLQYATIAWNVMEVFVTVGLGLAAGSLALIAFGLDSLVEVFASLVVVWYIADDTALGRERRALRMVAVAFAVLALYLFGASIYNIAVGRGRRLVTARHRLSRSHGLRDVRPRTTEAPLGRSRRQRSVRGRGIDDLPRRLPRDRHPHRSRAQRGRPGSGGPTRPRPRWWPGSVPAKPSRTGTKLASRVVVVDADDGGVETSTRETNAGSGVVLTDRAPARAAALAKAIATATRSAVSSDFLTTADPSGQIGDVITVVPSGPDRQSDVGATTSRTTIVHWLPRPADDLGEEAAIAAPAPPSERGTDVESLEPHSPQSEC